MACADSPQETTSPLGYPPGCKLAFHSTRDRDDGIFVAAADSTTPIRIGTGQRAAWSWSGSQLAIVDGSSIWVVDADGENARRIIDTGVSSGTFPPSLLYADWSPDDQRIAFVDSSWGISIMNADGTNPTQLLSNAALIPDDVLAGYGGPDAPRSVGDLSWLPDGHTISYVGTFGSVVTGDVYNSRLLTVDLDGTITPVQTNTVWNGRWSPDGSLIAFSVYGGICLKTASPSGRQPQLSAILEHDPWLVVSPGWQPAWSPDGQQLVFNRSYRWSRGLAALDLDTGATRNVFAIGNTYDDNSPACAHTR